MSTPRRRALILAAPHLVLTALSRAFVGRRLGTITVALHADGPSRAMLMVADDGGDRSLQHLADPYCVLDDLIAVVDGSVACRQNAGGGTLVKLLLSTQFG